MTVKQLEDFLVSFHAPDAEVLIGNNTGTGESPEFIVVKYGVSEDLTPLEAEHIIIG